MIDQLISSDIAADLCRGIISDLPDYFGLPVANEHYVYGVSSCVNFGVQLDRKYIILYSGSVLLYP